MRLFVGLGNPGAKYRSNRHNIGFMAVDRLVHRHNFSQWRKKFQGEVSEGKLGTEKILVLKPQTYMNKSGSSVRAAAQFYKIPPEDIYVFQDELALPFGKIKVKNGGGHGGHNGLRDIDSHIGKNYWRIRMGIGHPGDKSRVHNHVLGDFAKSEEAALTDMLIAITDEITLLADGKTDRFASKIGTALEHLNPKPKKQKSKNNQEG